MALGRYRGGCHCGAVAYEVEVDLDRTATCNCSYCRKRGAILAFAPQSSFTLERGEDALTDYRFNTRRIAHLFCSTCGIHSFGRGTAPDGQPTVAINVLCLDGVEPATLSPHAYDGRSL